MLFLVLALVQLACAGLYTDSCGMVWTDTCVPFERDNETAYYEELAASFAPIADNLSRLLDAQERVMSLPRTILYCINPAHSYVVGSMIGNFQQSDLQGKLQIGPPWRFYNQRDGIQSHLQLLSNLSLLNRSIGMTADSRSFASFSRHEYFRRILCERIGIWVSYGEYPNDIGALRTIVRDICYHNAARYFE